MGFMIASGLFNYFLLFSSTKYFNVEYYIFRIFRADLTYLLTFEQVQNIQNTLLPHSKKDMGSIPILVMGSFCVVFTCFTLVGVGFFWVLRFLCVVPKHAY